MNLAASCHLLNRPPLNRPPHVDIRKKSTPEPRVAVAGKNVKYHICISYLLGVAAMAYYGYLKSQHSLHATLGAGIRRERTRVCGGM